MEAFCPRCSAAPAHVESTTARIDGTTARFDLSLWCGCGVRWQVRELAHGQALAIVREAVDRHRGSGTTRVSHALLLELAGHVDAAYAEYAAAMRCRDAFARAYCHERRAAYELQRGWLRSALRSLRAAFAQDRVEGAANQERYRAACVHLERELTTRGLPFAPEDHDHADRAWLRACELERPPGFDAVDERGDPLSDEVIEVDRLVRASRWRDAIAAMRSLDPSGKVDAIGLASRGVDDMHAAGALDEAVEMQRLVVDAHVILASWSTSGAEGTSRMGDVERERARLESLRAR